MQSHHAAAPARPTADWIQHYATEVLASTPSLHPLDAVRQALQASELQAEPAPRTAAPSPSRHP